MRTFIFASAEIKNYDFCLEYLKEEGIVICCDGGLNHAEKLNIMPDYIVGDFDSVSSEVLDKYKKLGIPIQEFPAQKDETDMELGLDFAVKLGSLDIIIFGGIGSRFDHTLANAHLLLRLLKKGVRGRLVNENNIVELIENDLDIFGKKGDIVSTIPLSMEVHGLTLIGFLYPLTDKTLTIDDDIVAVSNIMLSDTASISIKSGYLFVIKSRD